MSTRAGLIVLGCLLAALLTGVAALYRLRLASGDSFPAYSSFRSDPLGTRALYEGLAAMPGLQVTRGLEPLGTRLPEEGMTVFFAGMHEAAWKGVTQGEARAMEALLREGGRLVFVFAAEVEPTAPAPVPVEGPKDKERARKAEERAERLRQDLPDALQPADLSRRWSIGLETRWIMDREVGAERMADLPLPPRVPWRSDLHGVPKDAGKWTVIYTRGTSPVLMERRWGDGSIVIATDAYFLSNEAMGKERHPELLAWLVGNATTVVFSEVHLGVQQDVAIAALARRYGLGGAFFSLLVFALLFVWRRAATFVPLAEDPKELALEYQQTAGLEALLRRAVPVERLVATCVAAWKPGAPAREIARVEQALRAADPEKDPAGAYNAVVRTLDRKHLL